MRSTLAVAFAVLAVLAGLPFVLVCLAAGLREPLLAFGLGIARVCRRIAGISLDVSGAAALAPGTPRIYMPNHTSFLDGPLVMLAIPGAARVILKRSILRVPLVGTAMRFVGFVPVDRRGVEGGKKSIARAAAFMKERGYSYPSSPRGRAASTAGSGRSGGAASSWPWRPARPSFPSPSPARASSCPKGDPRRARDGSGSCSTRRCRRPASPSRPCRSSWTGSGRPYRGEGRGRRGWRGKGPARSSGSRARRPS